MPCLTTQTVAMHILALTGASASLSVAVLAGSRCLWQNLPARHSEACLDVADALLAEAGIDLPQLDAIAFGEGPGSFTGVRLACALAQGLALATDLPLCPVGDLAALAWLALQDSPAPLVAVAMDARQGELYWGLFAAASAQEGAILPLQPIALLQPRQAMLPGPGPWLAAGDGWALPSLDHLPVQRPNPLVTAVRADATAQLARHAVAQGHLISATEAMPVYLRPDPLQREAAQS